MKSTCREPIETTLSKSCFREDRIDPAGLIRQWHSEMREISRINASAMKRSVRTYFELFSRWNGQREILKGFHGDRSTIARQTFDLTLNLSIEDRRNDWMRCDTCHFLAWGFARWIHLGGFATREIHFFALIRVQWHTRICPTDRASLPSVRSLPHIACRVEQSVAFIIVTVLIGTRLYVGRTRFVFRFSHSTKGKTSTIVTIVTNWTRRNYLHISGGTSPLSVLLLSLRCLWSMDGWMRRISEWSSSMKHRRNSCASFHSDERRSIQKEILHIPLPAGWRNERMDWLSATQQRCHWDLSLD